MNLGLYILRRLLALIPTLLGISLISFFLVNLAPGGPVEQALQKIRYASAQNSSGMSASSNLDSGVTQEVVESLKAQYGFDKPVHIRYWNWLKKMVQFDFGESFTYHRPVWELIVEKFPISLTFGIISFLLTYLICIPLGIIKALKTGSTFDAVSSFFLFLTYSLPSLMLGILLIAFFGPGGINWLPIQNFTSENFSDLNFFEKAWDLITHMILPLTCYCIGSFASLTLLVKNSLLEEVNKDYVRTARAKGLSSRIVIMRHALRNALVPVATGLGGILGVFFAGSLIIETMFGLDGIGFLSYTSTLQRDFNVVMGLLMLQSFAALAGNLLSDVIYVLIDPRIDFSAEGASG